MVVDGDKMSADLEQNPVGTPDTGLEINDMASAISTRCDLVHILERKRIKSYCEHIIKVNHSGLNCLE